jgi:tetratricopeptide (TPR) repeat protein
MAENANDPFEQAKALYREKLTPDSTRQIRNLLQAFVATPGSHPAADVAEGWSLLANIRVCDHLNRWNNAGKPELDAAATAVENALRIDPNHAFAHYAKGFIHRAKGEHDEAHKAFKQSHDLDRSVRAHARYADELVYVGQPDEAVGDRQGDQDGLRPPGPGHVLLDQGAGLFFMGQYEEAIPWLRESISSWEALWYNWLYLASACALAGRQQEARQELRKFDRRFPECATLAHVDLLERRSPKETPLVVVARRNFRQGLRLAGMT